MQSAMQWLHRGLFAPWSRFGTPMDRRHAWWLCTAMILVPAAVELVLGQHTTLSSVVLVSLLLAGLLLGTRGAAGICAVAVATAVLGAGLDRITRGTALLAIGTYLGMTVIGIAFGQVSVSAADLEADSDEPEAVRVVPGTLPRVDDVHSENGVRVRVIEVQAAVVAEDAFSRRAVVLSERQRQVVRLAIAGLTAKQIGRMLYISERTVETHLANAYERLGLHSRSDLVDEFSRIA
jgi:DNA-binding CsgD family transcriptional regulator